MLPWINATCRPEIPWVLERCPRLCIWRTAWHLCYYIPILIHIFEAILRKVVWKRGKLWTKGLRILVELVEGDGEELEILWDGNDFWKEKFLVNSKESFRIVGSKHTLLRKRN